jgi:hypothetical protein
LGKLDGGIEMEMRKFNEVGYEPFHLIGDEGVLDELDEIVNEQRKRESNDMQESVNKKELDFTVFCIENIAERLNTNGANIYSLLTDNSKILDDYIVANYDALHTQGKEYIVNDIIEYMRKEDLLK